MKKLVYRYFLNTIACLSILLGLLGIVLPILPTTPFFILALFCFSRSSPYFHQQLLKAPYIGALLQDWQRHKTITKQRKQKIYLTILLTFFISLIIIGDRFFLQLMLLVILLILLFFIWRIPER